MTLLDLSIVNFALPSIDRGPRAHENALQFERRSPERVRRAGDY